MTIGVMAGPVTDARAGELLRRYRESFGGAELPVPVESIAEDLLGLHVVESDELGVSGLLLPLEREIWVNAAEARESPGRRRFTIAHELGHWVCQVLEGSEPAVRDAFSRADSVEAMAATFGVSREAMHWRLYNFGLVEERPA
jgi:hypothetical protein